MIDETLKQMPARTWNLTIPARTRLQFLNWETDVSHALAAIEADCQHPGFEPEHKHSDKMVCSECGFECQHEETRFEDGADICRDCGAVTETYPQY